MDIEKTAKIECGGDRKTPVFVTPFFDGVELRIGYFKTRLVRLQWKEASQIEDALRDAQEANDFFKRPHEKRVIKCGPHGKKTPVSVGTFGFAVELQIGEGRGNARCVILHEDQANQIADALRDARLK